MHIILVWLPSSMHWNRITAPSNIVPGDHNVRIGLSLDLTESSDMMGVELVVIVQEGNEIGLSHIHGTIPVMPCAKLLQVVRNGDSLHGRGLGVHRIKRTCQHGSAWWDGWNADRNSLSRATYYRPARNTDIDRSVRSFTHKRVVLFYSGKWGLRNLLHPCPPNQTCGLDQRSGPI